MNLCCLGQLVRYRFAVHAFLLGLLLNLLTACQRESALAVIPTPVVCSDLLAGCTFSERGDHIRFLSPAAVLKPFKVEVTAPDADGVTMSFSMAGMQMGLNRYQLVNTAKQQWQAEIVLPLCIQGRSDWEFSVEMRSSQEQRVYVSHFVIAAKH